MFFDSYSHLHNLTVCLKSGASSAFLYIFLLVMLCFIGRWFFHDNPVGFSSVWRIHTREKNLLEPSRHMSIVGPRPPLPREVEKYGAYERQRLLVRPGLTCYWQAKGRNEIGFHEWMELDMEYVYAHNLWVDIKLVWITIRMVLTGKGAM